MRVYEKDTDLKIPKWYLMLPQKTLNRVSDIGIALARRTAKRKIVRTNKRNIKFNI